AAVHVDVGRHRAEPGHEGEVEDRGHAAAGRRGEGLARQCKVTPRRLPLGLRYRSDHMDPIAAGFWGAFFGTATLMLGISLAAFVRLQRRVALTAGLSAVVSALFVLAYLGGLPLHGATEARVLAHLAVGVATV